jgi:hypothetical protein
MTTKLSIILLLGLTFVSKGQSPQLTHSDSILLSKTWSNIVKALTERNSNKLKEHCLKKIDCSICISYEQIYKEPVDNFIVPVDTFVKHVFSFVPNSKLWALIKSDEKQIYVSKTYQSDELAYFIVFNIVKRGEMGPKHEGVSILFEFSKIESGFRLNGFDSLP